MGMYLCVFISEHTTSAFVARVVPEMPRVQGPGGRLNLGSTVPYVEEEEEEEGGRGVRG